MENAEEAEQERKRADQKAEEAERQRALADQKAEEARNQQVRADQKTQEARQQQVRADQKAKEAEAMSKEAVAESQRAYKAEYGVRIVAARTALAAGEYPRAEDLLTQCSQELRGWEHGYLWAILVGTRVFGSRNDFTCAAYSPDSKRIAMGGQQGAVTLLEVAKPEAILLSAENGDTVRAVAFSPDGKQIVAGYGSGTLVVWDLDKKQQALLIKGHTGWVLRVLFSPNGTRIFSLYYDKGVTALRLWDSREGTEVAAIGLSRGDCAFAFSPDGNQFVCPTRSRGRTELTYRDVATGKEVRALQVHSRSILLDLTLSPDGQTIRGGCADGSICIWRTTDGGGKDTFKLLDTAKMQSRRGVRVTSSTFDPAQGRIALGYLDGVLEVLDSTTGETVRNVSRGLGQLRYEFSVAR